MYASFVAPIPLPAATAADDDEKPLRSERSELARLCLLWLDPGRPLVGVEELFVVVVVVVLL